MTDADLTKRKELKTAILLPRGTRGLQEDCKRACFLKIFYKRLYLYVFPVFPRGLLQNLEKRLNVPKDGIR